jgi:glycosyltransferase involved in cell wall biosynthesis
VKQYLLQKKFTQPVIVVGNGLDIKTIKKQIKNLDNIEPSNRISYFGRLSVTKGVYDLPIVLAKILKNYPDIQLDIIGASIPKIKNSLIEKLNQQNCQNHYLIHDFIQDKSEIFKILLQSKVIVFPSYEEGWGISLFEAIMTQRPVVTYNLPVFQEIFKGNLITAPTGNTKVFAQNTIDLIKNYSQESTKQYIESCYKIAQRYSWENVFLTEKKYLTKLVNL